LRVLLVSLLYLLIFALPVTMLSAFVRAWLAPSLGSAALVISGLGAFVVQALITFRFGFAWAHSIATHAFAFLQSWTLTRGRFWTIAGVLTPMLVFQFMLYVLGGFVSASVFSALAPSSGQAPGGTGWIIFVGLNQGARVLGSYALSAATVALYARLAPRSSMLAHVFS
jgi:hypothetical protein